MTASAERNRMMKRNNQNQPQGYGYPQQGGYFANNWQQQGTSYQGYSAPQGYAQPQQPQGYPQAQQPQGYSLNQGYQAGRNYQTPQVAENQGQPEAQENPSAFGGQAPYPQGGYPQSGYQAYGQAPAGYTGTPYNSQATGYQPNAGSSPAAYGYQGGQQPAGTYIPQTPYSQGYASPGYQAQGGYTQGYPSYNTQMGRNQQTSYYPQDMGGQGGQMPLNGGGYVPQQVPVRKQPFKLPDSWLLLISAALLVLFAAGMFASGMSILKWLFVILAAGTIAALWIKPMTDSNKKLCYTIVFGVLALVAVISAVTAGGGAGADPGQVPGNQGGQNVQAQAAAETPNPASVVTPGPTVTPEMEDDNGMFDRLDAFMKFWETNNYSEMVKLCSPDWVNDQQDPTAELFSVTRAWTASNAQLKEVSGTVNDTSRTVKVIATIDKHNTKDPVVYSINVIMVKDANDGQWYVDPQSLKSNDPEETPNPYTPAPTPTHTPETYMNTVLYYNPNGGTSYHRDQNCKSAHKRYLPFQGSFTFSQLKEDPYNKLKPCSICGAPEPDLFEDQ